MSLERALASLDALAAGRLAQARREQRPYAVTVVVDGRVLAVGFHPLLGDYGVFWRDGAYMAESREGAARGETPDAALLALCLPHAGRTDCIWLPPLVV